MAKVIAVIVSFVFPPAGVLIRKGIGADLVINVLLTLLAWLPGLVHALYHSVVDGVPVAGPEVEEQQNG